MEGGGADVFLLPNHKTRFFGIVKSVKSSRSYFSTGLVEPDFYYLLPFLTKAMVKSKQKTIDIVQCQCNTRRSRRRANLRCPSHLSTVCTSLVLIYETRFSHLSTDDGRNWRVWSTAHGLASEKWRNLRLYILSIYLLVSCSSLLCHLDDDVGCSCPVILLHRLRWTVSFFSFFSFFSGFYID